MRAIRSRVHAANGFGVRLRPIERAARHVQAGGHRVAHRVPPWLLLPLPARAVGAALLLVLALAAAVLMPAIGQPPRRNLIRGGIRTRARLGLGLGLGLGPGLGLGGGLRGRRVCHRGE